jgi:hypothetical protein
LAGTAGWQEGGALLYANADRGESRLMQGLHDLHPLTCHIKRKALLAQEEITLCGGDLAFSRLLTIFTRGQGCDPDRWRAPKATSGPDSFDPQVSSEFLNMAGRSRYKLDYAARAFAGSHGAAHPAFGIDQWLEMWRHGAATQWPDRAGLRYEYCKSFSMMTALRRDLYGRHDALRKACPACPARRGV